MDGQDSANLADLEVQIPSAVRGTTPKLYVRGHVANRNSAMALAVGPAGEIGNFRQVQWLRTHAPWGLLPEGAVEFEALLDLPPISLDPSTSLYVGNTGVGSQSPFFSLTEMVWYPGPPPATATGWVVGSVVG